MGVWDTVRDPKHISMMLAHPGHDVVTRAVTGLLAEVRQATAREQLRGVQERLVWEIAVTQLQRPGRGQDHVAAKQLAGKTKTEAIRSLRGMANTASSRRASTIPISRTVPPRCRSTRSRTLMLRHSWLAIYRSLWRSMSTRLQLRWSVAAS